MSQAREYLIEVPHSPEECSAAEAPDGAWSDRHGLPRIYRGCGAGTHTTWIIARLAGDGEAWRLVPELLRDTARVVRVERARAATDARSNRKERP